MNLTRLAVSRPVTTMMASLVVVLLGGVALSRLAVDLMPDLRDPTVSVITIYRGAGPEEVETLITRPLEQALSAVDRVQRISSTSAEGSSTVRVELQWGADIDAAMNDMRQAVQKIRQLLPDDIEEPYLQQYDVADRPIMYLGLSSQVPPIRLTQLAEAQIVPQLERLEGVARVRLRGEARREIQVFLERTELEARQLGVTDVVAALEKGSDNKPGGDIEQGHVKLLIESRGEFGSLQEIANTDVRQRENAVVKIRDIADVVDGEEERTELTRTDGQPGVMVYVYKQSGANTVEVSDRVHAAVERLNGSLQDARLTVRFDQSEFIRQAITGVRTSAFYGMLLAVLVLVVFLRSFRSTLVIAVSMPLSVLATFVLIYFKGFTLNMISFGGLALGIGLLVDNSIVVLESIFRRRAQGQDPTTAAIEGTGEVAAAIIASTLTTLIVFLPLLFIEGVTGLMLQQLAWVVSMSLVCSLVASLTLTPALATFWIPYREASPAKPSAPRRRWVERLHAFNERAFGSVERAYRRVLGFSFRFPGGVALVLLAAFSVSLGLAPRIGTEYLPKADEGYLRVDAEMAPGIQLAKLDEQSRRLERIVIDHVPEAVNTAVFIGDDEKDGDEWNESSYRVKLTPRSQRERSLDEIRRGLEAAIGPIGGMRVRVRASGEMMVFRMVSRRGGQSGDVEIEVRGHDMQMAEHVAEEVADLMRDVPGLVNVEVQREDRRPVLLADIDRAKASLLGVRVADITQTLETAMRGTQATVYRDGGDEFNVLVRMRHPDRRDEADVDQVAVATGTGRLVPLKSIVDFDPHQAAVAINRLDQQRTITVTADVEDRDLGGAVGELQQRWADLSLPVGFSVQIAGDWEEQQASFRALRWGFLLAVLLMYMVMASQFESLRDPLLILVSVPLGAIGVIVMLVLTGTTLNVQSFIGVVMLAGIVVNNAIVLVDYINQLRRREPETPVDELITRAAVRRFRPILMTTLTTVLAMIPIALGRGEGGELQAPMARVVIGGLTSGTLITLIAIPLVYRYVSRLRERSGTVRREP